jgi:hypothetical protein
MVRLSRQQRFEVSLRDIERALLERRQGLPKNLLDRYGARHGLQACSSIPRE